MRHTWNDFMVGLASIVALAGLSALLLLFGELTWLLESSYQLTLRANMAAGLRKGSQVMLEGVPVGEVKEVRLDTTNQLPVVLTLNMDRKQAVPASVRPTISAGLLGGGSRIDLRIPAGASKTVIDPANPPVLEARFTSLGDQIDTLMAKLTGGDGTIGRLMNDPKLYEEVTEAAERLALTLRDLQALVRRVKDEGLDIRF